MKKLIAILSALILLVSCAVAENIEPAVGSIMLSFGANRTTGFEWSAFIVGGDCVEIAPEGGWYVTDAAPDSLACGTGGTHYFQLNALKSGECIIRFTYARNWENEPMTMNYKLVSVDEEMRIYVTDVTDSGVFDGTVTEVNADDHSVLLSTERFGDVIARFDENETLPAPDEHIMVYTNGTMTMSLPAIVNVIGWGSDPSDFVRDQRVDPSDAPMQE